MNNKRIDSSSLAGNRANAKGRNSDESSLPPALPVLPPRRTPSDSPRREPFPGVDERPSSRMQAAQQQPAATGGTPGTGGTADKENKQKKRRPFVVRALLWLLRFSIVPLLLLASLIAGLYAGYVYIGNGPETDVWEWETWRHLYDLIFSDS